MNLCVLKGVECKISFFVNVHFIGFIEDAESLVHIKIAFSLLIMAVLQEFMLKILLKN